MVIYINQHDIYLYKDGFTLKGARQRGEEVVFEKPLFQVDELVILGNAIITPALLKHCVREKVGIHYLNQDGGYVANVGRGLSKNMPLRLEQYRAYENQAEKLKLAKAFVQGKFKNSIVFLRRSGCSELAKFSSLLERLPSVSDLEALRGLEGIFSKEYFAALGSLMPTGFEFGERSRRPPKDRANSMLSFAYTLLAKETESALSVAGLDPYLGYLHEVHYGRASLATDLMEELRPILADALVLSLLRRGEIKPDDFNCEGEYPRLSDEARGKFLAAWEQRLATRREHPINKKRLPYRGLILIQARLLASHLRGKRPYASMVLR